MDRVPLSLSVNDPRENLLGLAGAFVAASGALAGATPGSYVAAVAIWAAWFVLPAPGLVAAGALLVAALVPVTAVTVAGVAVGFVVVLGAALRTDEGAGDRHAVAGFLAAAVLLGVVAAGAYVGAMDTGLAALAVVVTGATVAYGIHRYERVTMGLVEADR